MKFLIDNNLSPRIVQALRELGFDSVHVREYSMQRASDSEVFDRAKGEDRIIISADTDFGFILARQKTAKPSVILFRYSSSFPNDQIKILKEVVEKFSSELEHGSLIVIEPGRVRIRALPLFPYEGNG